MAKEKIYQNKKNGNFDPLREANDDFIEKKLVLKKKERWQRRWRGEDNEELVGECTMPGCHVKIFSDCEYYTDDSGNIFCSLECVLEWYGVKRNAG